MSGDDELVVGVTGGSRGIGKGVARGLLVTYVIAPWKVSDLQHLPMTGEITLD